MAVLEYSRRRALLAVYCFISSREHISYFIFHIPNGEQHYSKNTMFLTAAQRNTSQITSRVWFKQLIDARSTFQRRTLAWNTDVNGRNVVLVDGIRLPFAQASTIYKDEMAVDLQRMVIKGLLTKTALNKNDVDYVICGTVIQEVRTSNIAREASLNAGLPNTIGSHTVSQVFIIIIIIIIHIIIFFNFMPLLYSNIPYILVFFISVTHPARLVSHPMQLFVRVPKRLFRGMLTSLLLEG
jgi:hypothetical protein